MCQGVLPEGEGEPDEGEAPEGEPAEGEGEGEDEGCGGGCGDAKDHTPAETIKRLLGDWLLIGMSLLVVLALARGKLGS